MDCILIGYGYWGRIVEKYLLASEEFRLLGVCDHHREDSVSLQELADKPDCAFVCVQTGKHFEVVQELLGQGIHVFCEKPLCRTLEDTKRLLQTARENSCVLFTDYIYTVSPSLQHIKRYLNRFGKVLYVDMAIRQFGRFYRKEHVYETVGVHMLSVLAYLFAGFPIEILRTENIVRNAEGYVEAGFIYFETAGVQGRIACSLLAEQKERVIRLVCEKGLLVFDMLGEHTAKAVAYEEKEGKRERRIVFEERFDEGNNLTAMLQLFAQTIREGSQDNVRVTLATADALEKVCRGLCVDEI